MAQKALSEPAAVDQVAAARDLVAAIRKKKLAAERRQAALENERAEIALSAHSGNRAAATRLAEIHGEASTMASELESFVAAIRHAEARVDVAVRNEAAAQRQAKAAEARKLVPALRARVTAIDEMLVSIFDHYEAFGREMQHMRQLGMPAPAADTIRVMFSRALASQVGSQLGLRAASTMGFEILSPSARRSFAQTGEMWLDGIERAAGSGSQERAREAA